MYCQNLFREGTAIYGIKPAKGRFLHVPFTIYIVSLLQGHTNRSINSFQNGYKHAFQKLMWQDKEHVLQSN